jgi:chitinase
MPAPSDVQSANGGATAGRAETGDSVAFTFAGAVTPSLVLSGWSGATTNVIVHLDHQGATTVLTVEDSGGTPIVELGSVDLDAHYTNGTGADFTGSTMTASGNTITVVLGTAGGNVKTVAVPTTMAWTTPHGSVSESGVPDVEF